MKIIYNSRPEFVELQKSIAQMEYSMLILLGEGDDDNFTIEFSECVSEDFGCRLYLPYFIKSPSGGLIKSCVFNVAR